MTRDTDSDSDAVESFSDESDEDSNVNDDAESDASHSDSESGRERRITSSQAKAIPIFPELLDHEIESQPLHVYLKHEDTGTITDSRIDVYTITIVSTIRY